MATETREETVSKSDTELAPRYNVVLLDDDEHTYEYVIEMLRGVFGHSAERAYQMALEVDSGGRAIVFTAHLELAELKQEQIHGYGADWRIPRCVGSMTAVLEGVAP